MKGFRQLILKKKRLKAKMKSSKILLVIVIAQFFCSSSWFAVNAVIGDVIKQTDASSSFLAFATTAIQFGFIVGTLSFALFSVADRFSPSKVFFVSSICVSLFNLVLLLPLISQAQILASRFVVGFFLAGIYPVGMKIAADYFEKGLGKSLGFLVGALVLGTAFPHLLKSFSLGIAWQSVIYGTSILTILGGFLLLFLVKDGPYKKSAQKLKFSALFDGFKSKDFRAAAFGYFGHMWELYTFWAFVPFMLQTQAELNQIQDLNIALLSFLVIASGSIACIMGGFLSTIFGEKKMASLFLLSSLLCCLLSPLFLFVGSTSLLMVFLIFWGMVVIADSPLFSTLVARFAPVASKGTALTLVNCIGFSITIFSIQFLHFFKDIINPQFSYTLLALGPIFGLWSLLRNR